MMNQGNSTNDLEKPFRVLVAGGGIGGLSAAIFLRRQGHHVEIFESSGFSSETGAAIHIPSNVNGLLRRAGMIPEKHGAVDLQWVSEYLPTGEQKFCRSIAGLQKNFPYPWQLIHRVDLHDALRKIATTADGYGPPAVLNLKSRVKSVDVQGAKLTLENGNTYVGDLIIAADGVHSKIRQQLLPHMTQPEPSGSSAFRFLIPVEIVRSTPEIAHFVEKPGEMRLHYAEDRRVVIYPCRDNTLLNFVAMHPDEETEASSEEWNQSASKEVLLSCYKSFPKDVQSLLTKADPESIKLWKLLDHDALGRENWVHGKVVMIGDAAHAFLPHQGQGGAQAIEDSAALGALLPRGTPVSEIPHRLELFVKARYDRATAVQDFTRQAAFKTAKGKHGGKVMDPMQFTDYNMNHDAYDHARGILLRDLNQNAVYRRMPLSFGPSPGPRQGLDGRGREMGQFSYKTSFISFITTKSYLSTLFPREDFVFTNTGTWATATFAVTQLSNLKWLGGRGYSMFGLYIHHVGVLTGSNDNEEQATVAAATAATTITNDFLPVLFENKADPIITGREELGFSKVFATIDEVGVTQSTSTPTAIQYTIGWEGTEFCNFSLQNLKEDPNATSVLQTPALHYKSIPSSRTVGENDANYVTPPFPALPSLPGEKRWRASASDAKIRFTELEGQELELAFPTLANIIRGLRDIRMFKVLECGIQASS